MQGVVGGCVGPSALCDPLGLLAHGAAMCKDVSGLQPLDTSRIHVASTPRWTLQDRQLSSRSILPLLSGLKVECFEPLMDTDEHGWGPCHTSVGVHSIRLGHCGTRACRVQRLSGPFHVQTMRDHAPDEGPRPIGSIDMPGSTRHRVKESAPSIG